MKAEQSEVLKLYKGKEIFLVTLENGKGMKVVISNYGGLIQSIVVPGKKGKELDIVLGFDTIEGYFSESYLSNQAYLGAVIGRYANRIKNARFQLDGKTVELTKNWGAHQLHGGIEGFDKKVWDIVVIEERPVPKVILSYLSKKDEEGLPGNLQVNLSFELSNNNELSFEAEAVTDEATAVNLTRHDYFNLNGNGSNIGDHLVEIPARYYLAQDEDYVATGDLIAVKGTAYNFTKPKLINKNWMEGEGYDQSFVLNKKPGEWGKAAVAYAPKTGIKLEVFTNQPTLQFYTGKYLNINQGKNGKKYSPFTGFCLETQQPVNAVNIPSFANTILRPGEVYRNKTCLKLSIIK